MREPNAPPAENRPRIDVREALGLAAACAKRGALEAAIAHLKDLLGAAPDHEIANGMLGGIYAELKMPERATACYERVLATNPRNVFARFPLGLLQRNGGRPQEALDTLRPNLSDNTEFLAHFYSGLAQRLHTTLTNSRLSLYANKGHFPWLEAGPRFFAEVVGFLGS